MHHRATVYLLIETKNQILISEAFSFISGAKSFESRTAKKYYLAMVRGHIEGNFIMINKGIGCDSRPEFRKIKMAAEVSQFCEKARNAETQIIVLARGFYKEDPVTKVSL